MMLIQCCNTPGPFRSIPSFFAQRAIGAVSGDQIVGDNSFLLSGFAIADDSTNRGGVLLQG